MTNTAQKKAHAKWWWPAGEYRGGRPSVFFFGGAGVEMAWAANPLIPLIGDYDFASWRMPGRGTRSDEPDPTSMRELGREIAQSIAEIAPVRPVLSGHSFGGYVGYAATQELEKLGIEVGRFVPIVAACPTEFRLGSVYTHMRGGPFKYASQRIAEADDIGLLPPELGDENLKESLRHTVAVDFALGFGALRHTPIAAGITDISASDDTQLKISHPKRWKRFTKGEFDSILTTGDHLFYREHPEIIAVAWEREGELAYSSVM
ncbi:alpha/beta fold hydrolase [Tsukamurella sp. 8F]|uniref:thioesterase II family protein n=1 Tax=unclassified Tsukamurella TaxID=2633480 RepID=UPI0023B96354|nr:MULTISPECIES: alpha/beta fold hydrolase [unclassified Tsukamurella]MDF0530311.1 alpha/beta fold hydrolase [Tsukamurella sp. 8J]MDF0587608.1 alpha/beta fold hydrolase [Tsukamurella sp. 8F]